MDPIILLRRLILLTLATFILTPCWGQYERFVHKVDFQDYYKNANYDEARVPEYSLPDPLLCLDGTRVTTVAEWESHRRPELVSLLETYMYGHAPAPDEGFRWEVVKTDSEYRDGKAIRRDVILHLTAEGPDVPLCIVVPKEDNQDKKQPAFFGLSFFENDSIWHCILHKHFYQKGQSSPLPDEWAAVGCWAWTISRAMDYLETDDLVDASRVALLGHSRLGKTVLWAGAIDQRFRVVIPVNSGCCGAALSRRCYGETVECVNEFSYQWFCGNFRQFSHREDEMPFDQHEVIALIAPRPVYVASAEDDLWADPYGEFLGAKGAEPVYALYGLSGIVNDEGQEQTEMPPVDAPATAGTIGYHYRKGPHAVLPYDWKQFISFADKYLK